MSFLPATAYDSSRRVLLVEDDSATAELIRRKLERSGFTVETASGVQAGLRALRAHESSHYVALLLDYKLPDGEPWEVADLAKAGIPETPVIFVTAVSDETVAIEAIRRGFADYVKKTHGFWDDLPAVLERVSRLSSIKRRLDETSALMGAIVEQSSDVIAVGDSDGTLVYVSPACNALIGRDATELVGRLWTEIVAPEERESLLAILPRTNENAGQSATLRCCRKDGSFAWVDARVASLSSRCSAQPMIVLTLHDVTSQRMHEERILASLREKEVLLKEIHHRVKNNLQVIQSLLRMRVRLLPVGDARAAIEATFQRVHAMALVHERLYGGQDLATLSLRDYLRDLFDGVATSSLAESGQVQLLLEAEDIKLSADSAVPFGLLANELLSNCFKHGFPGGRRGAIEISVQRVDGVVRMVVKDDGVGLPVHFDTSSTSSMGLKLAGSLAHQLGGRLLFSSQDGCRVESNFNRL
jgi:PAS domain S-box-containing protein